MKERVIEINEEIIFTHKLDKEFLKRNMEKFPHMCLECHKRYQFNPKSITHTCRMNHCKGNIVPIEMDLYLVKELVNLIKRRMK